MAQFYLPGSKKKIRNLMDRINFSSIHITEKSLTETEIELARQLSHHGYISLAKPGDYYLISNKGRSLINCL